ncbi:AAA family ATPase [Roseomonas frigidaquae]|uniref:AAA family ATPase n=1 Tax=Falsiroseomonas frigidaquae TaxID=487318 RepID=A0ABX1ETW6_9PROT|nr:AAA family ATPase [Falsiroseomonas frigidaquae]NKE43563.1 AAA family ATPase [Falsiroseomonas frigidaquae]
MKYAFWNNKGGTGKTSLAFQAICEYSLENPSKKILVVDVCPQANLSELFLGGLQNGGSNKLLERQGAMPRASIGGYFQLRLPSPYTMPPTIQLADFVSRPSRYNPAIPTNIELICGDPLLELQANAINTLANNQIPGTNTWIAVIDWISDLLRLAVGHDVIFFDCNPSFSVYTQIALAASDRLILPVMADDSSRRAVQNALSLLYGLKLPDPIYTTYAFSAKLEVAKRTLPKVHLIAKNRITQYMGSASAYAAVLNSVDDDIRALLLTHPHLFTFNSTKDGTVEVRDFQTSGVVAFARGVPFSQLKAGKQDIGGHRVQVKEDYRLDSLRAIRRLVAKL